MDHPRDAVVVGLAAGASVALVGLVAAVSKLPWVFPSLGPTAFILFASPRSAAASTRNTFCGHVVGLLSGALALAMFGLLFQPVDLEDVTLPRVGAVGVALGLTTTLVLLLGVPHPPAAATTLIVALGVLRSPRDFMVMTLAVVALIVLARIVNLARGYRLPLWSPPREAPPVAADGE